MQTLRGHPWSTVETLERQRGWRGGPPPREGARAAGGGCPHKGQVGSCTRPPWWVPGMPTACHPRPVLTSTAISRGNHWAAEGHTRPRSGATVGAKVTLRARPVQSSAGGQGAVRWAKGGGAAGCTDAGAEVWGQGQRGGLIWVPYVSKGEPGGAGRGGRPPGRKPLAVDAASGPGQFPQMSPVPSKNQPEKSMLNRSLLQEHRPPDRPL